MERAVASLKGDTKDRLSGCQSLSSILEKGCSQQLQDGWQNIADALMGCVKDNNPKVCLGALPPPLGSFPLPRPP